MLALAIHFEGAALVFRPCRQIAYRFRPRSSGWIKVVRSDAELVLE